jgi:hypothetical protein
VSPSLESKGKQSLNYYKKLFTIAGITIIVVAIFILFFPYQLPIVKTTNVPTLINGVTTMTSIVVAFGGVMFGAFVFREELKDDPKARSRYYESLGLFIIPPLYLWVAYMLLAWGVYDFAVRTSLTGFLVALLVFIAFYIFNSGRLNLKKT